MVDGQPHATCSPTPHRARVFAAILLAIFTGLARSAPPARAQAPLNAYQAAGAGAVPAGPAFPAPGVGGVGDWGIPPQYVPWWQPQVLQPLFSPATSLQITVDNAVLGTLMYSPQVRVLADMPVIRRTAVQQAEARFDPRAFMESKFINTDDPVGSTLITGGPENLLDRNWYSSAGIRSRTSLGGQVEVSQRMGYETSNSIYFVPPDQGTTRLALSFTQPLLNGAGRAYNTSMIVLADIDAQIADDQVAKELPTLLLEVHRGYWDLYLQRSALLQKRKLYRQSLEIFNDLNGRREVDVLGNQLARARAAVAGREGAIIRFEAGVHNAEARLRSLINDPHIAAGRACELIPCQLPSRDYLAPDLADALAKALRNRPELNQAMREIRAAGVRAEVARNELLPVLNMLVDSYVSGLRGDGALGDALGDQFSSRRPSYSAGFQFEIPLGNRAANARLIQRRVELRQTMNQLQAAMANIGAEVELAVRDVSTSYREMVSRYYTIVATEAEIQGLSERWRLLPGDQAVAGVVLDELLGAQERLSNAEFDFSTAQVSYHVSLVSLHRATGMLLAAERIGRSEGTQDGLPVIQLHKDLGMPAAAVQRLPVPAEPQPPIAERQPAPAGYQPTPAELQPAAAGYRPAPAELQPAPAGYQPTPAELQPAPAGYQPTPAELQPAAAPAGAPRGWPTMAPLDVLPGGPAAPSSSLMLQSRLQELSPR